MVLRILCDPFNFIIYKTEVTSPPLANVTTGLVLNKGLSKTLLSANEISEKELID